MRLCLHLEETTGPATLPGTTALRTTLIDASAGPWQRWTSQEVVADACLHDDADAAAAIRAHLRAQVFLAYLRQLDTPEAADARRARHEQAMLAVVRQGAEAPVPQADD